MIYNRQKLPIIETKKIKISKTSNYNFEIEYCLKTITSESIEEYRNNSKELNNLKLVFTILTTGEESYLPGFQNYLKRGSALSDFKRKYPSYVGEASVSDIIDNSDTTIIQAKRKSVEKILVSSGKMTISLPRFSESALNKIENIHLVFFLQFSTSEDFITKYHITRDSEIGYELMMKRDSQGLNPVSTRDVFYINSPSDPSKSFPYVGPAHYHSEGNPGPGGYVGWMAGHSRGKMGPELQIRKVGNYKVIFVNELNIEKAQKKESEIPQTFPSLSTGKSILKAAKMPVKLQSAAIKTTSNSEIAKASQSATEKDNKSFFYGLGNACSHISIIDDSSNDASYSLNKYGNYYGSVFGIDFLSMLKYRSRHGPLINYHFNSGEMNIMEEILERSAITKIEIKRKRISSRPNLKNQKGTLEYTNFSRNDKEKRIVLSSDVDISTRYKGKLRKFRSLDGEIQEINLSALSSTGEIFQHPDCKYIRQFIFKDFDLFHNNTYGKYTYFVEVEVSDGMESLLKNRYDQLQKTIVNFEKYSQSILMKIKRERYEKKQKITNKNKDYEKIDKQNIAFTTETVNLYFEILNLLEGKRINKNKKQLVINAISGTNLDIDSINKFLSNLKKINNLFKSKIKEENKNQSGKVSSSNLVGAIPGIISQTFKTDLSVSAFDESRILANYVPNLGKSPVVSLEDLQATLSMVRSKSFANLYAPTSLVTIKGQEYKSEDSFGKFAKSEKKISPIHIDVLASSKNKKNKTQEANLKLKIAVLESPKSEKKFLSKKGELFFAREAQHLGAGIKLKINGKDMASVEESEIEDKDASGLSIPDVSSVIQKSIFDSTKEVEDKNRILKNIEKEYKKITNIREKLGPIYDGITTAMKITNSSVQTSTANKIYESKYKGKNSTPQNSNASSQVPLMDNYASRLKVILPGIYEQQINIGSIQIKKYENDTSMPSFIMMKLETVVPKNILQSNNIFFVKV